MTPGKNTAVRGRGRPNSRAIYPCGSDVVVEHLKIGNRAEVGGQSKSVAGNVVAAGTIIPVDDIIVLKRYIGGCTERQWRCIGFEATEWISLCGIAVSYQCNVLSATTLVTFHV